MSTSDLRSDYTRFEHVDTNALDWVEDPSTGCERLGPASEARATLIVRYPPGARSRDTAHPDADEVFVLEGVVTADGVDHGPGSWLFYPGGSERALSTTSGCTLYVKVGQAPGDDRKAERVDTNRFDYEAHFFSGFAMLHLLHQPPHPERVYLLRVDAGATVPTVRLPGGAEFFVLEGSFDDEKGHHPTHTWLRYPPGSSHTPRTSEGCLLYVRKNHMGTRLV